MAHADESSSGDRRVAGVGSESRAASDRNARAVDVSVVPRIVAAGSRSPNRIRLSALPRRTGHTRVTANLICLKRGRTNRFRTTRAARSHGHPRSLRLTQWPMECVGHESKSSFLTLLSLLLIVALLSIVCEFRNRAALRVVLLVREVQFSIPYTTCVFT